MSANRKYIQLSIDDLRTLQRIAEVGAELEEDRNPDTPQSYIDSIERVLFAVDQLLNKAVATDNPRICLAHAVGRKG
jgi:hypothetical protein